MSQAFDVGAYVKYGGTGICRIDRIEELEFPGQRTPRACYVLRPLRNSAIEVSVPLDNPTLCGKIKSLLSREEADRLLLAARSEEPIPWIEDRKQRSQEFRKLIAGGDTATLLRLVHSILLHKASCGKRLSTADDNVRRDAERLLDEEYAYSMGISAEEAGRYIRSHLNPDSKK